MFERIADGTTATREAARLAALGVPTFMRYVKQGRENVRPVSGTWDACRVTRMIRNSLYRGEQTYRGKLAEIPREVPAIISAEVWHRANRRLTDNRRLSARNSRHFYLLAGLVRCGRCGHGYQGIHVANRDKRYYQCSHMTTGDEAVARRRCRAKAVKADWLDGEVWADCEAFLRNPGQVMREVRRQYLQLHQDAAALSTRRRDLIAALATKDRERQTVIGMARRGTIRPDEAESELEAIAGEQRELQAQLDAIANRQALADAFEERASSAEALLGQIRARVDEGLDDETRREVVRQLVGEIAVQTEGEAYRKSARVRIRYLFGQPRELASEPIRVDVGELLSA